ncbi:hypothetical protein [Gilliamella mensalis]|uniref:hypothetical protein n=1 Tax=Gilliamella mensalis TaxID=1908520 RepID=UPI000A168549|nr:hypothetical protein [Gilliamella mensalis]
MKNILILGASGSLAKVVIPVLLQNHEMKLALFVRHSHKLISLANERVATIQGDVLGLVNTAGVSPSQASAPRIFEVDLYGNALLFDTFSGIMQKVVRLYSLVRNLHTVNR